MPSCTPNISINFNNANPLGLPASFSGVTLSLLSHHFNQIYCTKDGFTQKFDIILPENNGNPCPLVIYIHGGGFTGGNKSKAYDSLNKKNAITYLLGNKIAFASINYRKVTPGNETTGIVKPLFDCVSALQHFRRWASVYNINKTRIGLTGSSAGAGAALLIAFSPDMKLTTGSNQVLKQSTRVKAVAAIDTQATYDIRKWHADIFSNQINMGEVFNIITTLKLQAFNLVNPSLNPIIDQNQIQNQIANYINATVNYKGNTGINLDMLSLMTKNDPTVWVETKNLDVLVDDSTLINVLNHHPRHAQALLDSANSLSGTGTLDIISKTVITDNRPAKGYSGKQWYHWMADQLI